MTDTEWIKPGALCWYAPHQASDRKYAGVVAGNVHLCGETPCVSLKDMEYAYRDGHRSTVSSAALHCVTQRAAGKSIDAVRRLIEVASQMNIDDHTEEQWGELAQAVAEADEFMAAPCVCSCCGVLIPFDLCVSCQYDLSERGYLNKKVGGS
ncbi:hypothetical protein UFOVP75_211 [uncultured Caudovirales phage]|uniref:Uncharacterized protein n=1 Tax=uncultured Caudovirales phage TaxID=2100421 RepID=A0A6J5L2L1_9CAUD|nr:hypothetical protein UFOVP75_211 [uncultured Caudovirales phage]